MTQATLTIPDFTQHALSVGEMNTLVTSVFRQKGSTNTRGFHQKHNETFSRFLERFDFLKVGDIDLEDLHTFMVPTKMAYFKVWTQTRFVAMDGSYFLCVLYEMFIKTEVLHKNLDHKLNYLFLTWGVSGATVLVKVLFEKDTYSFVMLEKPQDVMFSPGDVLFYRKKSH